MRKNAIIISSPGKFINHLGGVEEKFNCGHKTEGFSLSIELNTCSELINSVAEKLSSQP